MWRQRAHADWLKDGDRNTKYFHCHANQRNKHNLILGLEDESRLWVEDEDRVGNMVEGISQTFSLHQIPWFFMRFWLECQPLLLQK